MTAHTISHTAYRLDMAYSQCYDSLCCISFGVCSYALSLTAPWVHIAWVAAIRAKSPTVWVCQCQWINAAALFFTTSNFAPPPLTNVHSSIFNAIFYFVYPYTNWTKQCINNALPQRNLPLQHTYTYTEISLTTYTKFQLLLPVLLSLSLSLSCRDSCRCLSSLCLNVAYLLSCLMLNYTVNVFSVFPLYWDFLVSIMGFPSPTWSFDTFLMHYSVSGNKVPDAWQFLYLFYLYSLSSFHLTSFIQVLLVVS